MTFHGVYFDEPPENYDRPARRSPARGGAEVMAPSPSTQRWGTSGRRRFSACASRNTTHHVGCEGRR